MKWDEDTFGREYDLDVYNIVAVDDFNMGAMENKGLNIFVREKERFYAFTSRSGFVGIETKQNASYSALHSYTFMLKHVNMFLN